MDRTEALEKLRLIGQQHLLNWFDELPPPEKDSLLEQVDRLNIPTYRMQEQMLVAHQRHPMRLVDPFSSYDKAGSAEHAARGKQLIAEGKAGCLLIAGGQGTRLKFNGPKGSFPISPLEKKSLFQLFAEKVLAAGKRAGRPLPLAVMTSPSNHQQTLAFFEEHRLFGLDPDQLDFFMQDNLPFLDHDGNLFLREKSEIARGPDGNGASLSHFVNSGIWNAWYDKGVRYVNYVLVDNPLADPFDAELIGYHSDQGAEVIIKCTARKNADEKVGVLVRHEDKVKVVEYSELPDEEKKAADENGNLKYRLANLSLFSFTMDFIKKVSKAELPFHLALKACPYIDDQGRTVLPEAPNSWKFEKFIFDILPHALKANALLYSRESCFAPLKNASGEASPEEVRAALQERDRAVFSAITGNPPPEFSFELSQDFYYPTPELKEKWQGKRLESEGYVKA